MADRIVIEGKIIYPKRKKYERHGACPACEGKNYTYIEIDKEYYLQCHDVKCKMEIGAPYTEEETKSIIEEFTNKIPCSAELDLAMQYESE